MKNLPFEAGQHYWFEKTGIVVLFHGKSQTGYPIFEFTKGTESIGQAFSASDTFFVRNGQPTAVAPDFKIPPKERTDSPNFRAQILDNLWR